MHDASASASVFDYNVYCENVYNFQHKYNMFVVPQCRRVSVCSKEHTPNHFRLIKFECVLCTDLSCTHIDTDTTHYAHSSHNRNVFQIFRSLLSILDCITTTIMWCYNKRQWYHFTRISLRSALKIHRTTFDASNVANNFFRCLLFNEIIAHDAWTTNDDGKWCTKNPVQFNIDYTECRIWRGYIKQFEANKFSAPDAIRLIWVNQNICRQSLLVVFTKYIALKLFTISFTATFINQLMCKHWIV